MKVVRLAALASLLGLLSTSAFAQAGAGKLSLAASGPTSAATAGSVPSSGMGRMGPRGGHRAGSWGADDSACRRAWRPHARSTSARCLRRP